MTATQVNVYDSTDASLYSFGCRRLLRLHRGRRRRRLRRRLRRRPRRLQRADRGLRGLYSPPSSRPPPMPPTAIATQVATLNGHIDPGVRDRLGVPLRLRRRRRLPTKATPRAPTRRLNRLLRGGQLLQRPRRRPRRPRQPRTPPPPTTSACTSPPRSPARSRAPIRPSPPPTSRSPPTPSPRSATPSPPSTATSTPRAIPTSTSPPAHFDWGTDTSYGHSAPCAQGNSFSSAASVTAALAKPARRRHLPLSPPPHHRRGGRVHRRRSAPSPPPPSRLATDSATGISHTTASLNGHFDPQGDSTLFVTECHFDWGTDTSYTGGAVPCLQGNSFNSASGVSAFLPNLHPGTTYHFRLDLKTANGDTYAGADRTLVPTAFPVFTDPATTVHHTDVTLNGHFDPQGDAAPERHRLPLRLGHRHLLRPQRPLRAGQLLHLRRLGQRPSSTTSPRASPITTASTSPPPAPASSPAPIRA